MELTDIHSTIDEIHPQIIENNVEILKFVRKLGKPKVIKNANNDYRFEIKMSRSEFHGYLSKINAINKLDKEWNNKFNDLAEKVTALELNLSMHKVKCFISFYLIPISI